MKLTKNMVVGLLLLCAALPGLWLSYVGVQEPWTLFRLARIIFSQAGNHLAGYTTAATAYRVEHLGVEFVDAALLHSGWLAEQIALLPLGSLFLPVAYFALAYLLSRSKGLAVLTALYVGWYYPRLVSQYSIQTYVWTHLLFLGFLMVLERWIANRNAAHSVLIMFLFVITFLFYQTTPFWIIVAVVVSSLLIFLRERQIRGARRISWALPMFCIVIYLTFDSVLYTNFLQRIVGEAMNEELFRSLAVKVLAPLFRQTILDLRPYEMAPTSPPLATWSTLVSLLIMSLPVGFWVLFKVLRAIRSRSSLSLLSDEDIWIWSLLAVALSHALGYSAYGAISTRVIPLVFPFILIMIPRGLGMRTNLLAYILMSLLLIVSVIGFFSYAPTLTPDARPSDMGSLAAMIPDRAVLLADANVFGAVQISGASQGKVFELSWLDSEQYAQLVTPSPIAAYFDFALVDKYQKPLVTAGWVYLEPWSKYEALISNNRWFNRIYDSTYITLYQPIGRPIPAGSMVNSSFPSSSSFFWLMIGILGVLVSEFVLPGAMFIMLLRRRLAMDVEGDLALATLSLAAGVGVVILLGYLANFTWLGLSSIPWLILILSFILGLATLFRRKNLSLLIRPMARDIALFLSVLVAWSLLFTSLTQYRNYARSGEHLEFYVTQNQESGNLIIHIVSYNTEVLPFSVVHLADGAERGVVSSVLPPKKHVQYELSWEEWSGKKSQLKLSVPGHEDLQLRFTLP